MSHPAKSGLLISLLFLIAIGLPAQEIKVKAISLKAFPEINLVLSVENSWGAPVPVDTSKLRLFEQDRPIDGVRVVPQDSLTSPIFTVIVLDKSGSMKGDAIVAAREGAVEFINGMRGDDQAAYIVFDTEVEVISEFTSARDALIGHVRGTVTGTDTALLDAVFRGLELQEKAPTNAVKIVLALTDGRENRSKHTVDDVIDKARAANVSIYTIGLGSQIDASMLKQMASKTEANYYHAPEPSALVEIYRRVSELLHSQLQATFTTPLPMDDLWHTIRIVIPYMGREIAGEKPYLSALESKIPADLVMKINEAQAKMQTQTGGQPAGGGGKSNKTLMIILAGTAIALVLLLLLILALKKKR